MKELSVDLAARVVKGVEQSAQQLQYAGQEGARRASAQTSVCACAAATVAYTKNAYRGPTVSPNFTYSASACGRQVSGSTNYQMVLGVTTLTVPLQATARFP